jgi:ribosome modulation factor
MTAKTTQAARIEGEDAYFNGLSETANPYPADDERHLSWSNGWLNAQESQPGVL